MPIGAHMTNEEMQRLAEIACERLNEAAIRITRVDGDLHDAIMKALEALPHRTDLIGPIHASASAITKTALDGIRSAADVFIDSVLMKLNSENKEKC